MSLQASTTALASTLPERRSLPRRQIAVGIWLALLVAVTVFLLLTGGFATWGNVKAIFLASSFVGLLALAQTVVMISGNFFSLSLGTTSVMAAMIFLSSLQQGIVVAILLAVISAAAVSAIQGLVIAAWRVNPIVLTIAADALLTGVVLWVSNGSIIRPHTGTPGIQWLANPIAGIAFPFYVLVVAVALVHLLLKRTRLGMSAFLVGESIDAARMAALPVARICGLVFAVAGILAAVAGILLGASQSGATLSTEGTLPFDAIVATLVGGCAVSGGRGSAVGAFLGTLGVAALSSALLLRGYSEGVQILMKGVLLLIVVISVHLWNSRPAL
jgi:ribose/xylose/arabinose/galactoside ABC-type transport system permease subunit